MQRETGAPRIALIPGGTGGIGRAIALALGRQGWTIAACYFKSEKKAAALESELRNLGANCMIARCNVSDPQDVVDLVRKVENEFGRIDALINCVGSYHRINIMQETVEGWHEMFDNNLHPVFYLSRAVAPGMIQRKWGRIINFSMVNADQHVGQPFVTGHYIAKAGVFILSRSLAKVLAPDGITVNCISPGFIDSGGVPPEVLAQSFQSIPAGRVGAPEDAVAAACFLLSDEASYINGTNIHVSGAWGI
jgi:3-oxoacyl-[acyl-carrier protein] reductase